MYVSKVDNESAQADQMFSQSLAEQTGGRAAQAVCVLSKSG